MSTASRGSFDLLTEPWIPVRDLAGDMQELGVLDLFARAHQLRSIGGELPTTTFALVRFLLAILHRSFDVESSTPEGVWGQLWAAERLPTALIREYLLEFESRFDLLHPAHPFFQVADLRTGKDEVSGLERLIADVPNGTPFFTTRSGAALEAIPYAEAARWLLHAQAFDMSGIKSGAVGDSRVKGGKGYPIGTGWAGNIGGVLVEGRTVRETLLLNLVLGDYRHGFAGLSEADLPVWERAPLTAGLELVHEVPRSLPEGPADLFTWPNRRIRLVHDGHSVIGVVLCNGDPLGPQNQFVEPMTTWRLSENQGKLLGTQVYMPRTHEPAKSMWRGLAAILPQGVFEHQRASGAPVLPSGTLEWLGRLQRLDLPGGPWLPADLVINTRAIGMEYGPQSSTVTEIIDDALDVHAVLFGVDGRDLADRAIGAVRATEAAVSAVVMLAGNLAVAAGGDSAGPRDRTREITFSAVDAPFRRWLTELDSTTDVLDALFGWFDTARRLVSSAAADLIAEAGPVAWVGRTDSLGRHVDTVIADIWFRAALKKALPQPGLLDEQLEAVTAAPTTKKETT